MWRSGLLSARANGFDSGTGIGNLGTGRNIAVSVYVSLRQYSMIPGNSASIEKCAVGLAIAESGAVWTTGRGGDGHGEIELMHVVLSLRCPSCFRTTRVPLSFRDFTARLLYIATVRHRRLPDVERTYFEALASPNDSRADRTYIEHSSRHVACNSKASSR